MQKATVSSSAVLISDCGTSASASAFGATNFHWMTGGESVAGSWLLKTERLSAGKPRQLVLQLRQLNLQLALAGARVAGKDVQD